MNHNKIKILTTLYIKTTVLKTKESIEATHQLIVSYSKLPRKLRAVHQLYKTISRKKENQLKSGEYQNTLKTRRGKKKVCNQEENNTLEPV